MAQASAGEALFRSAKAGRDDDLAELLQSCPAYPVDAADPDGLGNTPLHYAAAGGHLAAARVLLAAGAPHSAANPLGDTPLHKAAARAGPAMVRLLLEAGADPLARNGDGQRPQDLARDADSAELLVPPALEEYGSDDDMDPFAGDVADDSD